MRFHSLERFLCCPSNSNFAVNLLTYDFAVNMRPSSQRIAFAADFSAIAQQNLLMRQSLDHFFATLSRFACFSVLWTTSTDALQRFSMPLQAMIDRCLERFLMPLLAMIATKFAYLHLHWCEWFSTSWNCLFTTVFRRSFPPALHDDRQRTSFRWNSSRVSNQTIWLPWTTCYYGSSFSHVTEH